MFADPGRCPQLASALRERLLPGSIAFIVNPRARGGRLGRIWPQIFAALRHHLLPFEHCSEYLSKHRGDCRVLAQEAVHQGRSHIIAVGGDGTLNEVLNGLVDAGAVASHAADSESPRLGLLPYGTGGDFRTAIGMPFEVTRAAEAFLQGTSRNVDVGMVEYTAENGQLRTRAFLNVASCGISAEVSGLVNSATLRLGSQLPYLIATLKALMRFRNVALRITLDDNSEPVLLNQMKTIAVANGPWFGGNMRIAPDALLNDGKFDITAIEDPGFFTALRHLRHLYDGTLKRLPEVKTWQATRIRIENLETRRNVPIELDGETPGKLPATFTVLPNAARILVPG